MEKFLNRMYTTQTLTSDKLVERFCTPPTIQETEFDQKAVADAEILKFEFEGHQLTGYAWGEGKHVLLAHGWGSRASHLSPLGKMLARLGFRVTAFDAPAHGRSLKHTELQQSSLFEYCRALSMVANTLSPLYALVGHSLGAASAIFTAAGHAKLSEYQITPERLVSISAPENVSRMITLFCQQNNLGNAAEPILTQGLEQAFNFSIADYSVIQALQQVTVPILFVHDEDDDEVPVSSAYQLKQARDDARLVFTRGAGHQRILANRTMIRAVKDFLSTE